MSQPFSALAKVYETFISDANYEEWAKYLTDLVKTYANGKQGVDMACGSGYFTRALKKEGFFMVGVDQSIDMLNEATKTAFKNELDITFINGDMQKVKILNKADFITVVNDGINYIPPQNLQKTFSHFYKLLKQDGTLFFDISSEYKLKNIIGNNMFAEDTNDATYLWFNRLSNDKVEMDISVFTRQSDDRFIKQEESQTQYIHKVDMLVDILKKSGYKSVIVQNHMNKQTLNPERIQFIAKKKV